MITDHKISHNYACNYVRTYIITNLQSTVQLCEMPKTTDLCYKNLQPIIMCMQRVYLYIRFVVCTYT